MSLDLTMGGRCISGEESVRFFESVLEMLPDKIKTDYFCNRYEYSLNRLRYLVRKDVPIAVKEFKGNFTSYSCGQCGAVCDVLDCFCGKCGRKIDWKHISWRQIK